MIKELVTQHKSEAHRSSMAQRSKLAFVSYIRLYTRTDTISLNSLLVLASPLNVW